MNSKQLLAGILLVLSLVIARMVKAEVYEDTSVTAHSRTTVTSSETSPVVGSSSMQLTSKGITQDLGAKVSSEIDTAKASGNDVREAESHQKEGIRALSRDDPGQALEHFRKAESLLAGRKTGGRSPRGNSEPDQSDE
jgi:hypothetical protein